MSRVRLAVGLACLAGAATYLVASLSAGGSTPAASACEPSRLPAVRQVPPQALGELREAVAGVLPGRIGRLYEEGTVVAANAFSDNSPSPPPVSASASRPGAYEMRWWAPNGDDVVADVFAFADPGAAQRFISGALSVRCRRMAAQEGAARPPQAENLTWTNPDGVREADVYLLRGARVYRVVDVPARQTRHPARSLARAQATVDALACLLPQARCGEPSRLVPA